MAFSFNMSLPVLLFCAILFGGSIAQGQLSTTFYDSSCPSLKSIVSSEMANAIAREARMGASILRLFFHDCFVNGCDASLLLDDTATFTGEKNTPPNKDSARGFEVIDAIKSRVEAACPATVSCADILALAALEGTSQLGGPTWTVPLGRRDATTASQDAVNSDIPTPADNLDKLISLFVRKGFSAQDMTALSGAHTIGLARCINFRQHIYGDSDIDAGFAALRQQNCPSSGGDDNLAPLDLQSSDRFDNLFYQNLMLKKGLLHSDQELFSGGSQDSVVTTYSNNANAFKGDFAAAMVKMGNMSPLTGLNGEIRLNCRRVN